MFGNCVLASQQQFQSKAEWIVADTATFPVALFQCDGELHTMRKLSTASVSFATTAIDASAAAAAATRVVTASTIWTFGQFTHNVKIAPAHAYDRSK